MKKRVLSTLLTLSLGTTTALQAKTEESREIKRFEIEKSHAKPLIKKVLEKHTGDLDAMLKQQTIRVLVVNSKAFYGVQKGKKYGIYHDALVALEKQINKNYPNANKHIKTKLIPVPVTRELLIPALNTGYGDLALADNTITKSRQAEVDFTDAFATGINEVLVTGENEKEIQDFEDISGKEVYVKPSASYMDALVHVSETLVLKGYDPVKIRALPEELESEDILELLNDGVIGITIMDDYKVEMWNAVYKNPALHQDLTFREDGELGIMVRKNNPLLLKELNLFVKKYQLGTEYTEAVTKKYYSAKNYLKEIRSGVTKQKFKHLKKTFKKYADRYDLDPLILMAQAYQESQLISRARSHVGARGIMQLMPATGRQMKVGNINNTDANIHAGVKYHRLLKDHYFNDESLDKLNRTLFIFAGYNAGPNKINRLRKVAEKRGLDPNVWFGNVEVIAAEVIGRETVQYIENIYNSYVAYTLINIEEEAKLKAKISMYAYKENSKLEKKAAEVRTELALLEQSR